MDKQVISLMQQGLRKHVPSGYGLSVDGIIGPKTLDVLNRIPGIDRNWPLERKVYGCIQYICRLEHIDAGSVDGYLGPQTEYGMELLYGRLNNLPPIVWRREEKTSTPSPNVWPVQRYSELVRFFGQVGTNQTTISVPYPLKLAWNPSEVITKFTCHQKVADPIRRVLTATLDHYGKQAIEELGLNNWGGCLNVRKMRGGTEYSTHSWGIAVDWDPLNNKLKWGRDQAKLARPEYDVWWNLWEREGAISLGRARNYDFMHVQFATFPV